MYRSETVIGKLAGVFTGIALFIACLGLFGLAAFTAQQRTKEIGIRKVLGATVSNVVIFLTKDVVRLVLIALVIAALPAYVAMQRWLDNFAYRVEIGPFLLILVGALLVFIALLPVAYHAVKAATLDPVKSLRSE